MTPRATGLLLGGVVLLGLGRATGWPEMSALGGASVALVLLALMNGALRARAELQIDILPRHVSRGTAAGVGVRVAGRGRGLTIVLGPPAHPLQSVVVGRLRRGQDATVSVPLDTSSRGVRPAGPYALVQGDPWGLMCRTIGTVEGGLVTVHPRTMPVQRALLSSSRSGDSDVATRRAGDEHFHTLRDYVLGDEPRSVHWRSSARAGRLVVRQHVAAAADAVVVLLDVDSAAYGSGAAFSSAFLPERFEDAVDVAASLAVAQRVTSQQVHVATTARAMPTATAGTATAAPLLDALAIVAPLAPVDVAPEELRSSLRRLHCARLLVVSGDPDQRLVAALHVLARDLPLLLVRVDSRVGTHTGSLKVLAIDRPEDLS